MSTTTILIVDDDEDDRYLLQNAFQAANDKVQIEAMSNGNEALVYLKNAAPENLPCLIVLDYNMPVMNGKDVLIQLCKDERLEEIPKVIFSTSNAPYLIEDCIKNGAFDFKVKPNIFDELLVVANELLAICTSAI